jgi:UDPglucose 6-dehydrogenase
MNISVIGCGYVGMVTGACLASLGNKVLNYDNDTEKIRLFQNKKIKIDEPHLDIIINNNIIVNRLFYTDNLLETISHGEILVICIDTPLDEDRSINVENLNRFISEVGKCIFSPKIIVIKSTVPVGTAAYLYNLISGILKQRNIDPNFITIVSNPEFLREGNSVNDFMAPDQIIIGLPDSINYSFAKRKMSKLYSRINIKKSQIHFMNYESAELCKLAINAMIASRISFINQLADLADQVSVNIREVERAIVMDKRFGSGFLHSGQGYSGPCIPKDIIGLIRFADKKGIDLSIVKAAANYNSSICDSILNKIHKISGKNLSNLNSCILGAGFKNSSSSLKGSLAVDLSRLIIDNNGSISFYDPFISELDFRECVAKSNHLKIKKIIKLNSDEIKFDAVIFLQDTNVYVNFYKSIIKRYHYLIIDACRISNKRIRN